MRVAATLCAITCLMLAGRGGSSPIVTLLEAHPRLAKLAADPQHEIEIVYTQIDRDASGQPHFETSAAGAGIGRYFYPASTIKFPAALLAVETLRAYDIEGLGLDTIMEVGADPEQPWQTEAVPDLDSPSGGSTLGGYLRKIFLYSDNDAYNRVFEFTGADRLNNGLREKGYSGARLTYRLSVGSEPWHGRHSNPTVFRDGERVLLKTAAAQSADFSVPEPILRGQAEWRGGKRLAQPKDFRQHNSLPLAAAQEMLTALLFPAAVPERSRFEITAEDRRFLLRAMGQWPSESRWPKLDPEKYHDAYVKPLVLGSEPGRPPANLRIFNKTGSAYGYLIDNAYIVDLENRVEFLLAARIYVNANATFNDDIYEYDTIGYPFLRDLGRAVLEHERTRVRDHRPDLSEFDIGS